MRKTYHTEYPFWRLQNDGIWEVENAGIFEKRAGNTNAKKSDLLKKEAIGGFKNSIFQTLQSDPEMIPAIIKIILDQHFPYSIHSDILSAIGLESDGFPKTKRDPEFRNKILRAYEYKCAVCGFDVRLGGNSIGLEAAHIKWHQAKGPDIEKNGLALCSLHHKLFDLGAFTLTTGLEIHVSELAYGNQGFREWLLQFHGLNISYPIRKDYQPADRFIKWHYNEVFKKPGRTLSERQAP